MQPKTRAGKFRQTRVGKIIGGALTAGILLSVVVFSSAILAGSVFPQSPAPSPSDDVMSRGSLLEGDGLPLTKDATPDKANRANGEGRDQDGIYLKNWKYTFGMTTP